ncbi:hypothetical protein VTP01DRAFT_5275 [Rhizomucor pusillus]|uniref:uncharacterized protein n=1 Tax=Rhizomucor pusillus TaxID=4840 RepID=UPI0037425E34
MGLSPYNIRIKGHLCNREAMDLSWCLHFDCSVICCNLPFSFAVIIVIDMANPSITQQISVCSYNFPARG